MVPAPMSWSWCGSEPPPSVCTIAYQHQMTIGWCSRTCRVPLPTHLPAFSEEKERLLWFFIRQYICFSLWVSSYNSGNCSLWRQVALLWAEEWEWWEWWCWYWSMMDPCFLQSGCWCRDLGGFIIDACMVFTIAFAALVSWAATGHLTMR